MNGSTVPAVGTVLRLTTSDGVVLAVRFVGMGNKRTRKPLASVPAVWPWVEALESGGLYRRGEMFHTGWERLSHP